MKATTRFPWLRHYKRKVSGGVKIEKLELRRVPNSGVYILCVDKVKFPFPRGKSNVLYIGKSEGRMRIRLGDHKRYTKEAGLKRKLDRYYPRYEYGEAFGCRVFWIMTSKFTARNAEKKIMIDFAARYGAPPVTNAMSYWKEI